MMNHQPRRRSPGFTVLRTLLLALPLISPACGGSPPASEADGALRVERSTEGNVTTVHNAAGSRWSGAATLEMELEIGVDEGDERYMFNQPWPRWIDDDAIYVVEMRDARVRVYGRDGEHRADFGRKGQGPGEFEQPTDLVVTPYGRVGVASFGSGGIKVSWFDAGGEFVEDWMLGTLGPGTGVIPSPQGLALVGSELWIQVRERPERPGQAAHARVGLQQAGPEGLIGDPWFPPERELEYPMWEISMRGFSQEVPSPWAVSGAEIAMFPDGTRFWGYPDEYRFHLEHPDGTSTVVSRELEPVPVLEGEAAYLRESMLASIQSRGDADASYSGDELPATKPWYGSALADGDGRIFLVREGTATRNDPCTPADELQPGADNVRCWQARGLVDVFAADGTYLGALESDVNRGFAGGVLYRDRYLTMHQDDDGVARVRVYRIVPPAGTGG